MECHKREKDARLAAENLQASLRGDLEKALQEKLAAEKRVK